MLIVCRCMHISNFHLHFLLVKKLLTLKFSGWNIYRLIFQFSLKFEFKIHFLQHKLVPPKLFFLSEVYKWKFEMCILQTMNNRMSYKKLNFSKVRGPTSYGSKETYILGKDTWVPIKCPYFILSWKSSFNLIAFRLICFFI